MTDDFTAQHMVGGNIVHRDKRVARGGSWFDTWSMRSTTTFRLPVEPLRREPYLGFRCAADPEAKLRRLR